MLYLLENIGHSYAKKQALNMLPRLEIQRGEVLALTGANGAGKSTLLRLLAFLEKPTQGNIFYYGALDAQHSAQAPGKQGAQPKARSSSQARLECTLLLQDPYIFKQSVLDNVCYGLRLRQGTWSNSKQMQQKAGEALACVGFDDEQFLSRPWYQLSGGEKQRVALAARLVLEPCALLLDEPTAHVDGKSATAIHNAVQAVAQKGTTVVVASHDMTWLESLSPNYLRLDGCG